MAANDVIETRPLAWPGRPGRGERQNSAASCAPRDFSHVTLVLEDIECSVSYRGSPSRHVLHSDIGVKETFSVPWEMKTRMWI